MDDIDFNDCPSLGNNYSSVNTGIGTDNIFAGSNFRFCYDPNVQQMSAFGMSALSPFQTPLLPPMDPFVGLDFEDQLFNQGLSMTVDMFGQTHYGDMANVDMMSGLPASDFHPIPAQATTTSCGHTESGDTTDNRSLDRMKLDRNDEIIAERDLAVEKYHSAIDRHDYDEALRWERLANSKQGELYTLWDTPTYGVPPKAPGL